MLLSSINQKPGSMTIQLWQANRNALFWELVLITQCVCHTFLHSAPTHSKGSSMTSISHGKELQEWGWKSWNSKIMDGINRAKTYVHLPLPWTLTSREQNSSSTCFNITYSFLLFVSVFLKQQMASADVLWVRKGNVGRVQTMTLQKKCMAISQTSTIQLERITRDVLLPSLNDTLIC